MANELQLWAINGSSGGVVRIDSRNQAETEKLLEDTLVKQPNMLMPGLTLVGRQTPTAGGYLDLLGVDKDGRLIVFELKRGTLTRDAVTQVIDYASDLEAREFEDLCIHIRERSGAYGIDPIENFEEWYLQSFEGHSLKPVRMALVGLGVDDNATRIVTFLAERGVEIDLMTFHAFEHGGQTLLARHVELESSTPVKPVGRGRKGEAEYKREIAERVQDFGITFWDEALNQFGQIGSYSSLTALASGFVFRLPKLTLPKHELAFYACFSIKAIGPGQIKVTFLPIAIHLCRALFEDEDGSIPFSQEASHYAPFAGEVEQMWYCILDEAGWVKQKDALLALASNIYGAWDRARRGPQHIDGSE